VSIQDIFAHDADPFLAPDLSRIKLGGKEYKVMAQLGGNRG